MNKTIKSPSTVQELANTAQSLDMLPSEFLDLINDALGADWWEREPEEFTITLPRPAIIPPGFTPSDVVCDLYVGKIMTGDRWEIRAEYVPHLNDYSLIFTLKDDEPLSAAEAREYAQALLEMSSYITTTEWFMNTGVEDE